MKKTLHFLQNLFFYLISYLWYIALYLIILPYLLLLIGRNIDLLIFDYLLDLQAIFQIKYFTFSLTVLFGSTGVLLILWSFYVLYFYAEFFPLALFPSPGFNPKKLSTYGPYALVRHPMTLGYLLSLTAFGFYEGSLSMVLWIIPLLGFVFYEYIKHREERRLALWFGKEYEKYQRNTPFLFPRFFKKKHHKI